MLCFDAFFQEVVPQSKEEKYRVRKCKIYFYLEDDTIQVVEPELKNSGIPQGRPLHEETCHSSQKLWPLEKKQN